MSQTGLPHDVVEYPCSDCRPMAETEVRGACMMYVADGDAYDVGTAGSAQTAIVVAATWCTAQGSKQ